MATDPNGYGPFSIAQYISQSNGHNPRVHGAVLQDVNGDPAVRTANTRAGRAEHQLPDHPLRLRRGVAVPADQHQRPAVHLLNGLDSLVCSDKGTIISYGFALHQRGLRRDHPVARGRAVTTSPAWLTWSS